MALNGYLGDYKRHWNSRTRNIENHIDLREDRVSKDVTFGIAVPNIFLAEQSSA